MKKPTALKVHPRPQDRHRGLGSKKSSRWPRVTSNPQLAWRWEISSFSTDDVSVLFFVDVEIFLDTSKRQMSECENQLRTVMLKNRRLRRPDEAVWQEFVKQSIDLSGGAGLLPGRHLSCPWSSSSSCGTPTSTWALQWRDRLVSEPAYRGHVLPLRLPLGPLSGSDWLPHPSHCHCLELSWWTCSLHSRWPGGPHRTPRAEALDRVPPHLVGKPFSTKAQWGSGVLPMPGSPTIAWAAAPDVGATPEPQASVEWLAITWAPNWWSHAPGTTRTGHPRRWWEGKPSTAWPLPVAGCHGGGRGWPHGSPLLPCAWLP